MIKAAYKDHMGTDLSVVNAARVSFGKQSEWDDCCGNWDNLCSDCGEHRLKTKDSKLISYLARHKHLSPFGHCFASFHVKAPLFVARQLVKHKFLRWNEISRRYQEKVPEFYLPDFRVKAEDKKQGSGGYVGDEQQETTSYDFYRVNTAAVDSYLNAIDEGVCPEQARIVLPQSMMTEWYWSGSLDAFADMCNLRCKPDTQEETRVVADQISVLMGELFPVSWKVLTK